MKYPARAVRQPHGTQEVDLLTRIDAVLAHGFAGLRFSDLLEDRFQADTSAARLRHHRVFGVLGILLFDSFLIGDSMMVPDVLALSAWLRLGLLTPLSLLSLWFIGRVGSTTRENLIGINVLMMGLALVIIMTSTRSPNAQHYYVGIPMILLFANTVQRLRFWPALVSTVLLFGMVALGLSHVAAIPSEVRQTFVLVLGATAVMTLAALYSLERDERRAYLLHLREESLAREDLLTRLPNRLALEEFLHARLRAPRHDATRFDYLLYLDLDHFKTVNDTCGHAVGDRLLREISVVIRAQLDRNDFIARLGGDEFAVLLLDSDEAAAHAAGERIIKAVQDYRLSHDQTTFAVAVSIGTVAMDPAQSRRMSDVMAYADVACYAAKHAGRGRQFQYKHDDADIAQAHGTIDWGQRLRRALDQGRFRLYLQHIVNARGEIEGHEALIRLEGDDGNIVPPGAFLPAAKRLGLMTAIDRWVTREVFSMLVKNPDLPGYISVNLVPGSLSDRQFTGWLLSALRSRPELAGKLRFEITEVEKLQVASDELSLIDALRAMSFSIYLDDFGSGYASFELLKRIPVDGIKLDGTVVQDYMSDPVDQALVQAAVTLASRLNIKLIAEGVETVDVLDALCELGISNFQGYLFHKPESWQQVAKDHHTHTPLASRPSVVVTPEAAPTLPRQPAPLDSLRA
ncbi:putative bifunctional diguanylate cyclase/phosphodiesterase [Aquabacterium sp.]|uniref:putative bifunctional diguanylate cyclase/phosphodiesterase n=1 Tax=Aquabacterium sp. TaxID=1872578 RepID=UPI0035AF6077